MLLIHTIVFVLSSCPIDNGTDYTHTLTDTQRFQLVPFRWIANYTVVYLHCNVIVCHKEGNSRCSKGCQSSDLRRKRSTGDEEEHRITLGPVMLRKPLQSQSYRTFEGNFALKFSTLFFSAKVPTRRICLTVASILNWWSFALSSWSLHLIQGCNCKKKVVVSLRLG